MSIQIIVDGKQYEVDLQPFDDLPKLRDRMHLLHNVSLTNYSIYHSDDIVPDTVPMSALGITSRSVLKARRKGESGGSGSVESHSSVASSTLSPNPDPFSTLENTLTRSPRGSVSSTRGGVLLVDNMLSPQHQQQQSRSPQSAGFNPFDALEQQFSPSPASSAPNSTRAASSPFAPAPSPIAASTVQRSPPSISVATSHRGSLSSNASASSHVMPQMSPRGAAGSQRGSIISPNLQQATAVAAQRGSFIATNNHSNVVSTQHSHRNSLSITPTSTPMMMHQPQMSPSHSHHPSVVMSSNPFAAVEVAQQIQAQQNHQQQQQHAQYQQHLQQQQYQQQQQQQQAAFSQGLQSPSRHSLPQGHTKALTNMFERITKVNEITLGPNDVSPVVGTGASTTTGMKSSNSLDVITSSPGHSVNHSGSPSQRGSFSTPNPNPFALMESTKSPTVSTTATHSATSSLAVPPSHHSSSSSSSFDNSSLSTPLPALSTYQNDLAPHLLLLLESVEKETSDLALDLSDELELKLYALEQLKKKAAKIQQDRQQAAQLHQEKLLEYQAKIKAAEMNIQEEEKASALHQIECESIKRQHEKRLQALEQQGSTYALQRISQAEKMDTWLGDVKKSMGLLAVQREEAEAEMSGDRKRVVEKAVEVIEAGGRDVVKDVWKVMQGKLGGVEMQSSSTIAASSSFASLDTPSRSSRHNRVSTTNLGSGVWRKELAEMHAAGAFKEQKEEEESKRDRSAPTIAIAQT